MMEAAVVTGLPTTIEGWYRLTNQSRLFFNALPILDPHRLASMVTTDSQTPPRGVLRRLSNGNFAVFRRAFRLVNSVKMAARSMPSYIPGHREFRGSDSAVP
jgi:hypothetical protein